ncbi:Cysteine--tRNA ligase [Bienertia sinuspersici]
MERSEPSLVPEWLRSTGGGSLSHHVSSSKTDGPLVALPKRNRNLINTSHSDTSNSSVLERSSSANSRRSSSSNGSSKHDNNPYTRSYSGSTRNQRVKDRDKLGISDTWDSEYSEPLSSILGGRTEKDSLRRSQSMISRKPDEFTQRRTLTNLRSKAHNINGNGNGNGTISVGSASSGTQKVSFERDFPLLGSDERPTTPDITRVPSPGLSRGVQGLSIGTSPLIGCEGWTSALAEVPVVGSNSTGSSSSLQPASCAAGGPPSSASTSR